MNEGIRGSEPTFWRRILSLGLSVLAIVALDQATKLLVTSRLDLGESFPVIPGLLHFTLVRNTGMAFGLLSGTDVPGKTILVTLASVLALAAVTYYALRSPLGERTTRFGLTFILGGAFGNIVDRARLGYVVDFVDVFVGDSHWPAFNLADTCICIGVGLLLLDSLSRREPAREDESGGAVESGKAADVAELGNVGRGES
jgi:signal peptidase II